jgi:hypothetical protein
MPPWNREVRVLSPVVGHPTCHLDLQRRLREAGVEAAVRSVGRSRRWFRRRGAAGGDAAGAGVVDFRDRGDDVWAALRF